MKSPIPKMYSLIETDANYEISKIRKYRNDIEKMENMKYDSKADIYTCRNRQRLAVDHIRHSKSKTGYVSEKTVYKCEDCNECPYKSECIKGNYCKTPLEERIKTPQVAKTFLKYRGNAFFQIKDKIQKGRTRTHLFSLKSA